MVIKAGASTGGMDIPPLILNKKMGVPGIGRIVYVRFSDPDRSDVLPGYRKESVWDPARDDLYSACG